MSSRDVAYDLLLAAILDIRAISGGAGGSEDMHRINLLANLIHNWPDALRDARDESAFDAVIAKMWSGRDRRTDPWLAEHLDFFGIERSALDRGE